MQFINKRLAQPAILISLITLLSASFLYAQQIKNINAINNQRNISFNCILQAKDGILWYGTNKGLIKYDGEKFRTFENIAGLINAPITAIFLDDKNTLWLGHENGKISLYKQNKFITHEANAQIGNQAITSFVESNGLWIGTYGNGVYHINQVNKIEHYNADSGMGDEAVYTLCKDKENNVWAGTDGGLTCFKIEKSRIEISTFSMKKGIPDNIVRNLLLAQNGDLIIAMQDSGVCAFNIAKNEFKTCANWRFGPVKAIVEFEPQVFYIASESNGIYKCIVSDKKFGYASKLTYTEGINCKALNTLFKDRENNLWLMKKNGLTLLSQSRWKLFQSKSGLLTDTIMSVLVDSKNNCWIGSSKGLQVYSIPSNFESMPSSLIFREKIFEKQVTCIQEDNFGSIWFGTYGMGLYKYNTKTKKLKAVPLKTA